MTDNEAMVAHYRAVRLPEPLTTFVGSLSAAECSAVCDGLAEAFADAGVTVHSTRFDSMHSVGYSTWALPAPEATDVVAKLTTVATHWAAADAKVGLAVAAALAVFQVIASFRTRVALDLQQAAVLRVLRKAPKGGGWEVDEIAFRVPAHFELEGRDVEDILLELQGLTNASGAPVTWAVREADGRWWTSNV